MNTQQTTSNKLTFDLEIDDKVILTAPDDTSEQPGYPTDILKHYEGKPLTVRAIAGALGVRGLYKLVLVHNFPYPLNADWLKKET